MNALNSMYQRMTDRLAVVRERLTRPLTLAEKVLFGHLDDPEHQPFTRGREYLALRPDRVVFQDVLGQTGMLSFGHAVYYGLGGFLTAHALNVIGASKLPIPLPLLPLVGGLAGLAFAIIFGWVSTKRAGTAFAMISLGIGELVAACSLVLRSFFGGEGGISTNRTANSGCHANTQFSRNVPRLRPASARRPHGTSSASSR